MPEQATTTTEKPKRTRKAKAGKRAEPTEYVVLESYDVTVPNDEAKNAGDAIATVTAWREVDRLTARGGNEGTLLRKWGEAKKRTGTFKLVPARSWQGGIRLFEQTSMASEPIV